MKKTLFKIIKYGLLVSIIFILYQLLIPKNYNVQKFEERQDTQYWNLPTGSKIGYTFIKGNGSKERNPMVYLHGGPGGMIIDDIIDFLKPLALEGHDLYFYDQIGSGHSARLENINEYSVDRHKKDLEEIIKIIGAKKIIFFGQSWGALLAMQYLTENSNQVDKMIFSGPGPILPINPALFKIETPDSLGLIAPKFSNKEANEKINNWRSKFTAYCASVFQIKLVSDQEADDFFTALNSELKKSTVCDGSEMKASEGGGGYYSQIMTVKSFNKQVDHKDKIRGLNIPTLILKGQCDNQKWGFTQEYLELLPNTRLEIIENAGHSPQLKDRSKYLNIIKDFLK